MNRKQPKIGTYKLEAASGIRKNNPGLQSLLKFWGRYCELTLWHEAWARQRIKVIPVRRGDVLSWTGDRQKMVYFVCKGILARVTETEVKDQTKRQITSIAMPGLALTSTTHLYRSTPHEGNIIALRSGIVVAIPYKTIKAYKEIEPTVETLIDILINKKKRQVETHLQILHPTSAFQRYILFDTLLPEIRNATSQKEQADFLGISRDTVQKAQKFLLKPKTGLK